MPGSSHDGEDFQVIICTLELAGPVCTHICIYPKRHRGTSVTCQYCAGFHHKHLPDANVVSLTAAEGFSAGQMQVLPALPPAESRSSVHLLVGLGGLKS